MRQKFSNFVCYKVLIFENLMGIEDFLVRIGEFIPFDAGFEDDKLGIQIYTEPKEIKQVLIAYEVTSEVIDEAKNYNADTIVCFHPLIYHPVDRITYETRVGLLISKLIQNGLGLIVCHTNFDAFKGGTSWLFAEKLGLVNLDFLVANPKHSGFGFGVVGEFQQPIAEKEFLELVQKVTFSPLRWCKGKSGKISKVAIVGGSGMGFAKDAFQLPSDAFITADIKYHSFHEYNGRMMLVDPGHWEMEYFVPIGLKNLFENIFKQEITFFVSNIYTNPVRYFAEIDYNEKQKLLVVNKKGER